MNDKFFTSLENTIGIREFMDVYLGSPFTWDGLLTHEKMFEFLEFFGKDLPEVVPVRNITADDLLKGNIVFVRAENYQKRIVETKNKKTDEIVEHVFLDTDYKCKKGKLTAYKNPLNKRLGSSFLDELAAITRNSIENGVREKLMNGEEVEIEHFYSDPGFQLRMKRTNDKYADQKGKKRKRKEEDYEW